MFDQNDVNVLKLEDKTVVYTRRRHDRNSYDRGESCALSNLDQRWKMKKRRLMRGVIAETPPSDEGLDLLASWKELCNTQHPSSCMVCNWASWNSSSSTGESGKRVVRDIPEEEDSPFLLAL